MRSSEPKCITCGLPLGHPPRLNTLGNGRPCPTCVERLLAELPPLLPGGGLPERGRLVATDGGDDEEALEDLEPAEAGCLPRASARDDDEPDYDPAV